jgi:hypothetical protein
VSRHDLQCQRANCRRFHRAGTQCVHAKHDRRIHLDEVVELLIWGASLEDVAYRLGVLEQSIYRLAYRRGTPEERAVINRAMEGRKKHRPGKTRRQEAA